MIKIFQAAVLVVVTLAHAYANAESAAIKSIMTVTRQGLSTTVFSCGSMSNGTCNYLILTSLCQEKFLADGGKERTCSYREAVPPFQIKPGESKTISRLPSDFIYTMKVGAVPTVQDCLTSPIPH